MEARVVARTHETQDYNTRASYYVVVVVVAAVFVLLSIQDIVALGLVSGCTLCMCLCVCLCVYLLNFT